jgi:hypothetical protein
MYLARCCNSNLKGRVDYKEGLALDIFLLGSGNTGIQFQYKLSILLRIVKFYPFIGVVLFQIHLFPGSELPGCEMIFFRIRLKVPDPEPQHWVESTL